VAVALVSSARIMAVNVESTGEMQLLLLLQPSLDMATNVASETERAVALVAPKMGEMQIPAAAASDVTLQPTSVPNNKAAANTALGVKSANDATPKISHGLRMHVIQAQEWSSSFCA
jgi:hypothetical protein